MLKIINISKSYPGKNNVLQNVEFEVHSGEICALLGKNSSGKSSILRTIVDARDVDSGEIFIDNERFDENSISCKKKLGYVSDNEMMCKCFTGRQYINIKNCLYNIPKNEKEERIKKYVSMLYMNTAINKKISTYSKSMKQKLLIISALVHKPSLIVMDNPFSGLDYESVNQVIEVMEYERSHGVAILFSSHMLDVIDRIADKVVVIKAGLVIVDDRLDRVNQYTSLQNLLSNL